MARWVSVCRVDEVAEGKGRALEASGVRLAVFRQGGELIALSGRCPHSGGPLGFGWIEDAEVVCPLASLAVPAGRWPLHDDPRRVRAQVSL